MESINDCYEKILAIPQPKKVKLLGAIAFFFYSLFLLLLASYAFGGTRSKTVTRKNVVVFMEVMPGPLAALRYLAKRSDVSIAMIVLTISGWNTNLNAANDNVVAFLEMLRGEGYAGNVSVHYGNGVATVNSPALATLSVDPLTNLSTCTYRRALARRLIESADHAFSADKILDTWDISAPPNGRFTFFADALDAYLAANTATLLSLGATTDVAWYLRTRANNIGRVSGVVVAGGSFRQWGGNTKYAFPVNTLSEINFFLDPHGAHFVVQGSHGRPVTVIPLDASPECDEATFSRLFNTRVDGNRTENVVARSFTTLRINEAIPNRQSPVELTAAAYFADVYVQDGAQVSNSPIGVVNGVSMATDGASQVVGGSGTTIAPKVVLQVDSNVFWTHYENIDAMPFFGSSPK